MLKRRVSNKGKLGIAGMLCLNLLILAVGYGYFFNRPNPINEQLPAYDSELPALSQELTQLKPKWRLLLLTIVDAGSPDPELHYMNALYRAHQDDGLEVVAVYKGEAQMGNKIREQFGLTFPIIDDKNDRVQRAVHISASHSHSGMLLIDSSWRVKYSSYEVPQEDDLRMMIEKYVSGDIDYSYHSSNPHDFFRENQQIPSLRVQDLNSKALFWLDEKQLAGKSIVIFLAGCATCQTEQYVKRLAALQALPNAANGDEVIAVFSSNFSSSSLEAYAQRYQVSIPIYVLREQGFQLQDDYVTRHRLGDVEPLLVSCDGAGIVRKVRPLFTGKND